MGARQYPGRWNHAGTAVVYAAGSLSLMLLEALAHFDTDTAPPRFVFFEVEIPDDVAVRRVTERELHKNWRSWPHPKGTRDLGTAWAESGTTAILIVPSALVPQEDNVILNPGHGDFKRLRIGAAQPIQLDTRLVGR